MTTKKRGFSLYANQNFRDWLRKGRHDMEMASIDSKAPAGFTNPKPVSPSPTLELIPDVSYVVRLSPEASEEGSSIDLVLPNGNSITLFVENGRLHKSGPS